MRRCATCGLSVDEGVIFNRSKATKDGLSSRCKECNKQYLKQYYQTENGKTVIKQNLQTEKYKKYRKEYEKTEKYKASIKKYQQTEKYKEYVKEYRKTEQYRAMRVRYRQTEKYKKALEKYHQSEGYKESREKYIQSGRRYEVNKKHQQTKKCKERIKKYNQTEVSKEWLRKYRQTEKYKETQKRWQQTEKRKEWNKKNYVKNKVSMLLSGAIRRSLKGNKNGRHWEELTGWTLQQFKRRFVQLFSEGMTWKNHGEVWEIDHIIPLSAHNITSSECTDFKRAWALSNLQPLLKEENNFKRDKIEKPFQPTLF